MKQALAALSVLPFALAALAAPPAARPAPADLVAQLGSDDFRAREAAQAALQKCGPEALPALKAALASADPEIRLRAAPLLARLQRTADSAPRIAAKTLALDYANVPLAQAVTDLRARTGLNVTIDPARVADPLRKITCKTGELPVWEAVEALAAAAGLCEDFRAELDLPKVTNTGRRIVVSAPSAPPADAVPVVLIDGKQRLPAARSSAVRVTPLPRAFTGHRVQLGTGEVALAFDVAPAPGLGWQDVVEVKITKLIDDAGRSGGGGAMRTYETAPGELEDFGVVVGGGPVVAFRPGFGMRFDPRTGAPLYPDTAPNPRVIAVPLKIATPNARSLKRLEGKIFAELALSNQTLVTLVDPAKRSGTPVDGAGQTRLTVQSVTAARDGGTQYQVRLEYPSPWVQSARRGLNPGGLFPEAPRPPGQGHALLAYDAAGKQLFAPQHPQNFTDTSEDGLTLINNVTLVYKKGADPAKFVVTGPRPVIVEVPFALDNVQLP
jgi:hypothetical protein